MPKHKSLNQSGFSLVEGLLSIIAVAIVVFVGFYVYNAQKQTNKTLDSATKVSQSASPTFKKTTVSTTKAGTPSEVAATTFKVPELGIELANVPTSISDLTDYEFYTSAQGNGVQFSTGSLTQADPACSAKTGSSIGALETNKGVYDPKVNIDEDNTAFVKQFSGFWISYSHPEAACASEANSSAEQLHVTQTATFETYIDNTENLQPIQ